MMPVAERCRALQRDATDAEQRLWSMLRNRQLGGFKFRRQDAFGPYVLDFFCLREKLAIEADGGSHFTLEGQAHDRVRTVNLRDHGVRVLRFTNAQILKDSEVVPLTLTLSLRERETERDGSTRNARSFSQWWRSTNRNQDMDFTRSPATLARKVMNGQPLAGRGEK